MLSISILVRDDDPESLISDTLLATVYDVRVTRFLFPAEGDRSSTEVGIRKWANLLPDSGADSYRWRITYGWTADEVRRILEFLDLCKAELTRQAEGPDLILVGTMEGLLQATERISLLRESWERLVHSTTASS